MAGLNARIGNLVKFDLVEDVRNQKNAYSLWKPIGLGQRVL